MIEQNKIVCIQDMMLDVRRMMCYFKNRKRKQNDRRKI